MNVKKEILIFLNELCDIGICDPNRKLDYFLSKEFYEVDEFVREILLTEGMDPDIHLSLFRSIKRSFTDRFGCEIVFNNLEEDED